MYIIYIYIFTKNQKSSTLVDKSPVTFIYFTTFEKKRRVRSPLPTQPNFLVFGKYIYIYIIYMYIYIFTKNQKVWFLGRPDSSFLFKSCEIDKSYGRLVY